MNDDIIQRLEQNRIRTAEDLILGESKDLLDKLADSTQKMATESLVSSSIAHKPIDVEDMIAIAKRGMRESNFFYIVVNNHLPDDCLGIIQLRKEDADKFKQG